VISLLHNTQTSLFSAFCWLGVFWKDLLNNLFECFLLGCSCIGTCQARLPLVRVLSFSMSILFWILTCFRKISWTSHAEPASPLSEQLSCWKEYYEWRSIPLDSPAAVVLQWVIMMFLDSFCSPFPSTQDAFFHFLLQRHNSDNKLREYVSWACMWH